MTPFWHAGTTLATLLIKKGIVRKTGPVSYEVQTEEKLYRRHADQLLLHLQPQRSYNIAGRKRNDVMISVEHGDVDAADEQERTNTLLQHKR